MLSRRFAKQTTELKELKREVAQINEELTCAVASVVQKKMVPRRQYDKLVSDIQTLSAEMKVLVEDKRRMRDTIHALTEHVDLQNAFIAVSRRKRVECCSCCYVDVEDAVRCESGHPFCISCVDALSRQKLRQQCEEPTRTLTCFAVDHFDCNSCIPTSALMQCENGRRMCTECDVQDFKEHVLTLLEEEGRVTDALTHKLVCMRSDGTFRGYMCRMCQFGPMWHAYCDDLRAHHNDDVDGTPISNACPECGHLESSTSMLLAWSGAVRNVST